MLAINQGLRRLLLRDLTVKAHSRGRFVNPFYDGLFKLTLFEGLT